MKNKPITVAVHTLGCKVNQCDTDALLTKLTEAGYAVCVFSQSADIYIINTCTVTHTGDKKSMQMIRRARKQNPSAFVAVCGCMPRSQTDSIERISAAGADFIFDTRKSEDLLAKLKTLSPACDKTDTAAIIDTTTYMPLGTKSEAQALPTTESINGRTRAFIKIQDGCDRYCSYCIVPYVRGPVTSRPLTDILEESQIHIQRGIQEIVLTGIQVAAYGYITGSGHITLPGLIGKLASIPKRLRLSSIDPWAIDDAFLSVVAEYPTLCSHFHLSLQSGCDKTLANMNRRYTTADYANAAKKLKDLRPSMALTTDIIVGFPGETNDDFRESLNFAEEMGFARIHVFEYSQRTGTPAAGLSNQVTSQVKSSRSEEMRALAETLKQRFLHSQIGSREPVLFETKAKAPQQSPEIWQGHTDNYCMVQVQGTNLANTIQEVCITSVTDNGLTGELIKEAT